MVRGMHLIVSAFGAAVFCAPAMAAAGNGIHPRTPVEWTAPECLTVVDRSENATLHLDYGVPLDDTGRTPDEVDDSRTHQFLAFCKQFESLPNWITYADAERAAAKELVDLEDVEADDVFEMSSEWPAECWTRITPDAPRLPITAEQAAMGVDWDTSGLAQGTYIVAGYTWEPLFNLWSPRWGAVRVVDGPDPAQAPPTLMIVDDPSPIVRDGASMEVEGCLAAMSGSVVDVEWGTLVGAQEPEWQPQELGLELDETFTYVYEPRPAAVGELIRLRFTIEDPMGRTYVAFTPTPITVLHGEEPGCNDSGGFVAPSECDEDSGGSEAASSSSSTGPNKPDDTGCRNTIGTPSSAGWGLAALAFFVRRRGAAPA